MSKAVVFGGSGFLGSHIADALTAKGFEVTIFDIKPSKYLQANQHMIVGDILNQEEVRNAIKGATYVYHFAGIADIKEAQDKPVETVKANILSTTYLLDACREFKVKRFLYASTIYVYSKYGSFYRSSKQACELLVENYREVYNVNYTILRYGSLYGKRANHFNFIHNAVRQALLEGKITRKGTGSEIRDYINVLDAARASVEVLQDSYKNSYVMLTGTQTTKIKDLLQMIKEILDHKINIEYTNDHMEGHYLITPYSFQPKVAKKYVSEYYHDLGQGVLETIYDVYNELSKDPANNLNVVVPTSAEY